MAGKRRRRKEEEGSIVVAHTSVAHSYRRARGILHTRRHSKEEEGA